MNDFLALFPLNLVAFPGEELNLHIFEDRYKQLISECLVNESTFGVPSYVNTKIEYGTEVKINKLVKKYEDGRMDISTQATRVFKVISFNNPVHGKLYSGGTIAFLENSNDDDFAIRLEMLNLLKELFGILNISDKFELNETISTFPIAHKLGLSLQEEYELLKIPYENDRQNFVIKHLKKILPILNEVERTKHRIKLNGHFKNFDPLNF